MSGEGAPRVEAPAELTADFSAGYGDCFQIAGVPGQGAREWGRLSLRGADGAFGKIVWHGILGFDLAAPDVAGLWSAGSSASTSRDASSSRPTGG